MYICLCNPFSDKDVTSFLQRLNGAKAKVSEVYTCCSGGEKPQCCSCLQTVKDMIADHEKAKVPA